MKKPNPISWGKFPTFRFGERFVIGRITRKAQNSAIFENWHTLCCVLFVQRDGPAPTETQKETQTMTFDFAANRFFAAAFAVALSAVAFATAIVPASPMLVA
jgi:hypothetical protein